MRLNVPFYKQTTKLNCGPAALKMTLAFFGEEYDLALLEESVGIKEGFGISTVQIALGAARLGFTTELYSTSIGFNESNSDLEFYKKYVESDLGKRYKEMISEARKLGIVLEERSLTIEEILSKVGENSLPIVLLDWNVVKGEREKGYQGHFVPVVGYNEKGVFVHNHGLNIPKEFLEIPKNIFEEARKAKGTDEDIVFIYRK